MKTDVSYKARQQLFNVAMGLGRERSNDPDFPGLINHVYGEMAARGFYRRWAEMISSEA